jgi:ribosomal protein S27AE
MGVRKCPNCVDGRVEIPNPQNTEDKKLPPLKKLCSYCGGSGWIWQKGTRHQL